MLDRLFISKVRIKLLEKFLLSDPEEKFHVRLLVRELDEEINSIRRELQNLKDLGLLRSQRQGNKLLYFVNKHHQLYQPLRTLLFLNKEDVRAINENIRSLEGIQVALLTNNYIIKSYKEDTDIDLLIVGSTPVKEVQRVINRLDKQFEKELRVTLMSQEDFEFHKKKRTTFLLNILQQDKILLIGSINDLF